jgi:hypothetical protein
MWKKGEFMSTNSSRKSLKSQSRECEKNIVYGE